jgi:putative FmdB family regulatory protein
MPIFEYRCKECGEKFETLVYSTSDTEQVECPECGSAQTEKQMSMFASSGGNGSSSASANSCGSGSGHFT